MRIRRVTITRFRAIEQLQFCPGPRTVIIGPNNAGKSTIVEALDLLLHSGLGRPRPAPEEVDYFRRDPSEGFEIEAVLGDLPADLRADVHQHLEGFRDSGGEVVPEPDGDGIEPVVRVRVRGTPDFDVLHEFAKPESEAARFNPALRAKVGWVFDGRSRDPGRQLSFYQGGVLERLFVDADLDPALQALRDALGDGADSVNQDEAVEQVLQHLSGDLRALGVLEAEETAAFEAGAVSRRALLQTLRLALPLDDVFIPMSRQGRGVQRLVLVALLMRLAEDAGRLTIGGFEEPEEALEPLRQSHIAEMLGNIAERGGQIFVVSHSPEIVRSFGIEDFLLLDERAAGENARHLRGTLTAPVRQAYERRLDGAVVRGLFSRVPLLVEGPGDRAVFQVFWRALAAADAVAPAFQMGLDAVNSEGVANMPMLAAVLNDAGKSVAAWADQDTAEAQQVLTRLGQEGNCAGLLLHEAMPNPSNLEQALAHGCSLDALAKAMELVARERGYSWDRQKSELLSRCEGVEPDVREGAKASGSLVEFLAELDEMEARELVASCLSARSVTPYEIKGARQSRILAESIVETEGVPSNFAHAFREFARWIADGCPRGTEIQMTSSD